MIMNSTAMMKMVSGVFQAAPVVVSSLLYHQTRPSPLWYTGIGNGRRTSGAAALLVKTNRQDSAPSSTSTSGAQQQQQSDDTDSQDLQYVSQIKNVASSSSTTSYEIPKFHLISYFWMGYLSINSLDLGFGASQEKQRHALQWGLHSLLFCTRIRRQPTSFLIL